MLAIPFPAIDPVAIEIGPLAIRWYALAYLAGFLLGWRYAVRLARRDAGPPSGPDIDDFLTWAIIGVILGGRIGFALFYNPAYFLANPLEILKIWEGGMAFHGGLIGVVLAIILFARHRGHSPFVLGDIIACVTPIGLFFGRIANFINNELWGRPTDLPWAVTFPIPPEWQALIPTVPRHPSQLYEAFLEGLVLFVILALLARRPAVRARPGLLTGVFLTGYGVFRFLVEFVRQYDPREGLFLGVFTTGQLLSVPMVLAGIAFILWALRRPPRRQGRAAETEAAG
ncbi:MAG: prolipoprotein diacylglyceryl transferase [Alphaproteobacteria bacterium]|jgi:phosphatidylglycerol:prolipoprotein diacylglycerol transferase|nr:prolipoprotein diacylglyceryl transferase [Alphaproteobacteria bacterium]